MATTLVPFTLVLYLALRGGGYDAVVRSEVGVAVWWIVLLGAVSGLLPAVRVTRASRIMLGATIAFGVWSALGLIWTESSERTVIEITRIGTYAGVLALAIAVQGRDSLRRTVAAVGAACAVIGLLAVFSRLSPDLFPANRTADVLSFAKARLNYPLNYWNGLAYLVAIGIPLLLTVATESRRLATQALTTAVIPVLALCCFYTISRGGAATLLIAVAALFVLYPRRLAMVPTVALAVAGSALLIVAATQRDALENGLSTAAAQSQGDEMIAIVAVVAGGVALLRIAVGLATRYEVGPRWHPSRRTGRAAMLGVAGLAVAGGLALGAPGKLSSGWDEFKTPVGPEAGNTTGRFESASGNGRYQWWESAVDAGQTAPLTGIGPGTFEFWWAKEGTLPGFVRDAHSLFLESWAELGIVGLLLALAPILLVLGVGARRALAGHAEDRPWIAAATAGAVAFAVSAAVDWTWELAALPIAFMCLAAAILQAPDGPASSSGPHGGFSRLAIAGVATLAGLAIAVPMVGSGAIRSSQEAVDAQNLAAAEDRARLARDLQPWAATPPLQEALVFELQGKLDEAAVSAREATEEEPTNWRPWFVLARIEGARGDTVAADAASERARSLNPRSPLFAE